VNGPLVVVGDAVLDRDLAGRVERISPDAPVPVFAEDGGQDRPGGAGLAAVLAASTGRRPVRLVTAIGADEPGQRLRQLLAEAGVELVELPSDGPTGEKVRLYAGGQVVLRLDRGSGAGSLRANGVDLAGILMSASAVLVSDYGRGVAGLEPVRRALARAATRRAVVWDPHPRGGPPVRAARLVTPNESEIQAPGDPGRGSRRLPAIAAGAERARQQWGATGVAVTLGGDGALLTQGGAAPMVVPAPARSAGDTCGAGDQFAAAAALALAGGAVVSEAVQVAVASASAFVANGAARGVLIGADAPEPGIASKSGLAAARALADRVRSRGGVVVATGGCFDLLHPGHVATLRAARSLGDCLIVCLNSDASVRKLKGPDRPLSSEQDRAAVLSELSTVDAVVVFNDTTPAGILQQLRPDVWVKGGDYFIDDSPFGAEDGPGAMPEAAVLRTWGGQTVVVPYMTGHSTTELIRAAQRHGAVPG
jgi:D-beta-D-heptose 7-phosphate kinase / D-beta-D-heptose 1-phosphate adenosyltransferase